MIIYCTTPEQRGLYVAYVDPEMDVPYAQRKILYWDTETKKWGYPGSDQNYRGEVYGWIGPLPAMRLD